MDPIIAKNRVKELFSDFKKNKSTIIYERLKEDEVRQIYYALHSKLPGRDISLNLAFIYFLMSTMLRYNRFGNIRPIDTDDLFTRYQNMLTCLKRLEPKAHIYSWWHDMNLIRWQVYRKCANKAFNDELNAYIDDRIKALNNIRVNGIEREQSLNIEKTRLQLMEFLNSFKSGMITNIKTTLPYKLVQKNSTFHLHVDGVEVDVAIENEIKSSPIQHVQFVPDATLDEMGLSKNSYSQSTLSFVFHCLIDEGVNLDSVSYSDKEEFSWNYLYDFTYKAIRAIWNHLQSLGDDHVSWPPLPQDIGSIYWSVQSGEKKLDSGCLTNPATGFHISSNKRGVTHYEIPDEKAPLWSDNAYYYARLYAKSGQWEEAIFWINVASEALIDEFLRKISKDSDTYENLTTQENKFQSSEEILSEQYPEMSGKVSWPNTPIQASVYTKLKRALDYLKKDKKETKKIIGIYSSINKKRNKLFHGSAHDIGKDDIRIVLSSYCQLKSDLADIADSSEMNI